LRAYPDAAETTLSLKAKRVNTKSAATFLREAPSMSRCQALLGCSDLASAPSHREAVRGTKIAFVFLSGSRFVFCYVQPGGA